MNEPRERPEIDYPCPWTYILVGSDAQGLLAWIERVLSPTPHEKHLSRTSSGGKYCSVEVTVVVHDEQRRLEIFRALGSHPDVRYVL